MLGYAFMGKAHSRGFRALARSSRNRRSRRGTRLGLRPRPGTRWSPCSERVRLGGGGHRLARAGEPTRASGCSTTAARTRCTRSRRSQAVRGRQARALREAARAGRGRVARDVGRRPSAPASQHMCGFNYRFVPAVRRAREILERAASASRPFPRHVPAELGLGGPTRTSGASTARRRGRARSATSATHIIDLARYLVGDIAAVSALVRTCVPGRAVDDQFVATIEFENGVDRHARGIAAGARAASTTTRSRSTARHGSIAFDVERLNELQVADEKGFTRVLVTEPEHPFMQYWWPPGHISAGATRSRTRSPTSSRRSPARERSRRTAPHSRTGTVAAEVTDAILRSSASRKTETLSYRGSDG